MQRIHASCIQLKKGWHRLLQSLITNGTANIISGLLAGLRKIMKGMHTIISVSYLKSKGDEWFSKDPHVEQKLRLLHLKSALLDGISSPSATSSLSALLT